MQHRAAVGVIAAALVALLLGGCASSGGGAFRDRSERDEAARLLLQREAEKERALREAEAEAEAARREKDERAEKAQREADEDAERRKREEAADYEQERRHRRELKEAEHDAKIRELHKGSAAPPPDTAWERLAWIILNAERITRDGGGPWVMFQAVHGDLSYEQVHNDALRWILGEGPAPAPVDGLLSYEQYQAVKARHRP